MRTVAMTTIILIHLTKPIMTEKQRELISCLLYEKSFELLNYEQQFKIEMIMEIRGGSATLHIDKDGNIGGVKVDTQFRV